MNIDNIRKLAARLRSPSVQDHFQLDTWFETQQPGIPIGQAIYTCGTTACIAGHATVLAHPGRPKDEIPLYSEREIATDWLGLDGETASELFIPSSCKIDYELVTAEIAADVLDHLASTGEVMWPDEVLA